MRENWPSLNLRSVISQLGESVRNNGGFSPEKLRQAAKQNPEQLRGEVLLTLSSGPKNGQEVINAIAEVSVRPEASQIYPLLENLVDLGLATMKPKNDRKVYALTKTGKEAAASVQANPKPSAVSESAAWGIPSWVDLNGELPKSLLNLSRVSFEVSKSGSKEQQSEAAKVIDEARRKIHLILSAE